MEEKKDFVISIPAAVRTKGGGAEGRKISRFIAAKRLFLIFSDSRSWLLMRRPA
jgi:hypothetical protein